MQERERRKPRIKAVERVSRSKSGRGGSKESKPWKERAEAEAVRSGNRSKGVKKWKHERVEAETRMQ